MDEVSEPNGKFLCARGESLRKGFVNFKKMETLYVYIYGPNLTTVVKLVKVSMVFNILKLTKLLKNYVTADKKHCVC